MMSEPQESGAVQSGLPACLYDLEADLSVAVKMENYQKAAELRDELNDKRQQDAIASSLLKLREAVDAQDFEGAKEVQKRLGAAVAERSGPAKSGGKLEVNRLLVLTASGKLVTCRPDGGAMVDVGKRVAGDARVQFFQPTWSPSGDLIAATMLDLSTIQGKSPSSIESKVVCLWALDGSAAVEVNAPFVPFYMYWGHDSARLSYLTTYNDGPGGTAVSLDVVQVFEPEDSQAWTPLKEGGMMHVEEGVPLFYDQSPIDRRLLLHIGDKRQVKVHYPFEFDKEDVTLSSRPGDFRAPLWLSSSSSSSSSAAGAKQLVLFVERSSDGRRQSVVLADAEGGGAGGGAQGGGRRELVEVFGFTSMAASRDAQRVAVLARSDPSAPEQLFLLEGPFDIEPDPWPMALEPLAPPPKADLLAPKRKTLAMFWSPDSLKLLALTSPGREDLLTGKIEAGEGIRWEVTDVVSRRVTVFESVLPSAATLSSFLPFFDQYALSQSLWAPDSQSFCYAGKGIDNQEGAWVQRLPERGQTDPPPPQLVVSGVQLVSWSPC